DRDIHATALIVFRQHGPSSSYCAREGRRHCAMRARIAGRRPGTRSRSFCEEWERGDRKPFGGSQIAKEGTPMKRFTSPSAHLGYLPPSLVIATSTHLGPRSIMHRRQALLLLGSAIAAPFALGATARASGPEREFQKPIRFAPGTHEARIQRSIKSVR